MFPPRLDCKPRLGWRSGLRYGVPGVFKRELIKATPQLLCESRLVWNNGSLSTGALSLSSSLFLILFSSPVNHTRIQARARCGCYCLTMWDSVVGTGGRSSRGQPQTSLVSAPTPCCCSGADHLYLRLHFPQSKNSTWKMPEIIQKF